MKKNQHSQERFRKRNARWGDQIDVGFDRVEVTVRLLAWVTVWVENRKKTGPGGAEQIDSFPVLSLSMEERGQGTWCFGKRCLWVLRSIYLVEAECLTKQPWAGHIPGQVASFYDGLLIAYRGGAKKVTETHSSKFARRGHGRLRLGVP